MTMPSKVLMQSRKIKTDFEIASKCVSPYQWSEWNSFTDLSSEESDGYDYETLDHHRYKNPR